MYEIKVFLIKTNTTNTTTTICQLDIFLLFFRGGFESHLLKIKRKLILFLLCKRNVKIYF